MLSRFSRVRSVIALAALIAAMSVCGQTSSPGGGPTSSPTPPQPAPTATPDPSHFVVANQTASATVDDIALHLIGLDYSYSPPSPMTTLGATCGSLLVFTNANPSSLSASSVQQMRTYLMRLPNGNGLPYPSPTLSPPPGLNWIPAGSKCHVRFEVSNVSGQSGQASRDITINGLDLRLPAAPLAVLPFSATYAQVDICSVIVGILCEYPSAAPDNVYEADVQLSSGSAGATFPGTVTVGDVDPALYPPPPFILQAGQTRDIDVTISVPDGAALAYQVIPELLVNDGGAQTLTYNALRTNLSFAPTPATVRQWPCFGFMTNPDRIVPDSQVQYNAGAEHGYCY